HVSAGGAAAIAAVITGNLPSFAYLIAAGAGEAQRGGALGGVQLAWAPGLVVPDISRQDIDVLLNRAAGDPAAATALSGATGAYADWMITQIAQHPVTPGAAVPDANGHSLLDASGHSVLDANGNSVPDASGRSVSDASGQCALDANGRSVLDLINQAGAIRGAVDGSIADAQIQQAAHRDGQTSDGIDALGLVLLPLAPTVGEKWATWAEVVGMTIGWNALAAATFDTHTADQARAKSDGAKESGQLGHDAGYLAALLDNLAQAGIPASDIPPMPSADQSADLQAWVDDHGNDIRTRYFGSLSSLDRSAFASYTAQRDAAPEEVATRDRHTK
ncbi:MAG: hypothetical protein LBQ06_04170, partial [Frankiaceae bacterium]|nr:hypothetical protein [Frankiaceae bacterium]